MGRAQVATREVKRRPFFSQSQRQCGLARLPRPRQGAEVDLLVDLGADVIAVEAKSGRTLASDVFDSLTRLRADNPPAGTQRHVVVYGGSDSHTRSAGEVLSWTDVGDYRWI